MSGLHDAAKATVALDGCVRDDLRALCLCYRALPVGTLRDQTEEAAAYMIASLRARCAYWSEPRSYECDDVGRKANK